MEPLEQLGEKIAGALAGAVLGTRMALGELTLDVAPAEIVRVLTYLRDTEEFRSLIDICGVDWPEREKRFDVVYHLLSMRRNLRLRINLLGESFRPLAHVF